MRVFTRSSLHSVSVDISYSHVRGAKAVFLAGSPVAQRRTKRRLACKLLSGTRKAMALVGDLYGGLGQV